MGNNKHVCAIPPDSIYLSIYLSINYIQNLSAEQQSLESGLFDRSIFRNISQSLLWIIYIDIYIHTHW